MLVVKVFTIIFPVFAIVAIGYAYGKLKQPDMTITNRLNMDLFLPMLIFYALAGKSFQISAMSGFALAALLVILGSGLLVWPFCKLLKVDTRTFIPPMMFNNAGNMAIPLMILTFGEHVLPAAVVLFLVQMILQFTLGAYILDRHTRFLELLRMPMVFAMVAGILFSLTKLSMPPFIQVTIKMLADIGIPLVLFALGVRLTQVSLNHWKLGLWGAALCPLSGIVMVLLILPWFNLTALERNMLLMFGALPPAVMSYVLAEQYNQEPEKVASIVMIGTLASLIVMPLTIAYVLQYGA